MSEGDAAHKAGWINAATTVLTSYAGGNLSLGKFGQGRQMAAGTAASTAAKKSSASALNPSYIGIT
jgi:hypothetical protein